MGLVRLVLRGIGRALPLQDRAPGRAGGAGVKTWALVLPLAGAMAGSALLLHRPHARPPLGRAYWYWHHPFRISTADEATLQKPHVSRLYVHAGTVERGPEGLRVTSRQEWLGHPECELEAV